ncbi:hypothetical protein HK098_004607 [Nowakowskiella sp. JEL0407]|nr:hypothetical protein HK098_004607 [Nowakowskiella sp. JEL0407]
MTTPFSLRTRVYPLEIKKEIPSITPNNTPSDASDLFGTSPHNAPSLSSQTDDESNFFDAYNRDPSTTGSDFESLVSITPRAGKPFSTEELAARLDLLMGSAHKKTPSPKTPSPKVEYFSVQPDQVDRIRELSSKPVSTHPRRRVYPQLPELQESPKKPEPLVSEVFVPQPNPLQEVNSRESITQNPPNYIPAPPPVLPRPRADSIKSVNQAPSLQNYRLNQQVEHSSFNASSSSNPSNGMKQLPQPQQTQQPGFYETIGPVNIPPRRSSQTSPLTSPNSASIPTPRHRPTAKQSPMPTLTISKRVINKKLSENTIGRPQVNHLPRINEEKLPDSIENMKSAWPGLHNAYTVDSVHEVPNHPKNILEEPSPVDVEKVNPETDEDDTIRQSSDAYEPWSGSKKVLDAIRDESENESVRSKRKGNKSERKLRKEKKRRSKKIRKWLMVGAVVNLALLDAAVIAIVVLMIL